MTAGTQIRNGLVEPKEYCGGCGAHLGGSVHPVPASDRFKNYANGVSFICFDCFSETTEAERVAA